ncbi:MAG TPA: HD domain-containing phosphohydrolase, partial [Sporolactobacillaceae bacterium]|nr:HD domain-containing phosphohydrolase [Sporolactobacillaceae bacterium]
MENGTVTSQTVNHPQMPSQMADFSRHVSTLTELSAETIHVVLKAIPRYQSASAEVSDRHLRESFKAVIARLKRNGRLGDALNNAQLMAKVEALFVQLLSDQAVYLLLSELKSWHPTSYEHSIDVFILSALLGAKLQVPEIDQFALGCLLHDVGKRWIPKTVLAKKSKLTESEFALVQNHVLFGEQWLSLLGFPKHIVGYARHHHERLNGVGYPDHLIKENIREEWSLLSVIDVYSALTLTRAYRKPFPPERALEMILNASDQFCPQKTYSLMEMLQVFPNQMEVLLYDDQRATVLKETLESPSQLRVRETGARVLLSEYKIKQVLSWENPRLESLHRSVWESFLSCLINGKTKEALTFYEDLIDGKRVETIYNDVFYRAEKSLADQFFDGTITAEAYSLGLQTSLQLMNQKLVEYAPSYKVSLEQGIVFCPIDESQIFPLRLLHDVLFVNGWKTYFLKSHDREGETLTDRLIHLLAKKQIDYLVLCLTT